MTKINDYLWHLPHDPEFDEPPDIAMMAQSFNMPIVATLEGPLAELGYRVVSNDVIVPPDSEVTIAPMSNYYRGNVRFTRYVGMDVIIRVHFEHADWSHLLHAPEEHRFYINLDRFKLADVKTRLPEPGWPGRLHTRMSSLPGGLHHDGEDQVWMFGSPTELAILLDLFLEKFEREGHPWLIDTATYHG